jgi:hypothetical protein
MSVECSTLSSQRPATISAGSVHEISISGSSSLCLVIRLIHFLVSLLGTSVVPVIIGLLIWRLSRDQPINAVQIACAALGPWLLVYSFGRLSTVRGDPTWKLVALAVASAAAFVFAEVSSSRIPSSEMDLPANSNAYLFLAIAGVLLPVQSALQWWFQRTRLPVLGTGIGSVLKEPSSAAMRAKSISHFKGCLFAALGLTFLLLQTAADLAEAIAERENKYNSGLHFFIGVALLFRSRRYFQADADSLLSVDRRPPILLLRSFADDAKGRWFRMLTIWHFLDYSLESRLAKYFMRFGPFVAVGTPNETLPQIGAARKSFGDAEWQDAVLSWAKSAQLISIFVGSTHWVNWEVSQVLSLNLTDRLILLMPESRTWFRWRHNSAMQQRLAMLVQAMASTPWSEPIKQIGSAGSVRAIVLGRDASIVVIRSKLRTRDSYHLGAMIAHKLILKQKEGI